MSTMTVPADVIAAAIEAYTPEGVVEFLTNWTWADPQRRARMEAGVKAEWSGIWPTLPEQRVEPQPAEGGSSDG